MYIHPTRAGIDLPNVPEAFQKHQYCRICNYVYRECENMGQLNCRFHPKPLKIEIDDNGSIVTSYPCCGITPRVFGEKTDKFNVYSDGCTMCDHLAMDSASVTHSGSQIHVQLPHDFSTPFYRSRTRESYLHVFDIDMLEVFPCDLSRRYNIPAPYNNLVLKKFDTVDAFEEWLNNAALYVKTHVGGSLGRAIAEPRERIGKNSLGVQYIRKMKTSQVVMSADDMPELELREANMRASYSNTWKETVPYSESTVLSYSHPSDFFRIQRTGNFNGPVLLYQRASHVTGVSHARRGTKADIVT